MFEIQRERSFPLPDYDLSKSNVVKVTLHGKIIDERYSRILIERKDLSLDQVFFLDQLQKGKDIGPEGHQRLEDAGFQIGVYPNVVSMPLAAQATPDQLQSVATRDLRSDYYMNAIIDFVTNHGPVSRGEIYRHLRPILPKAWTEDQEWSTISDLVRHLQQSNLIENQGTDECPVWIRNAAS